MVKIKPNSKIPRKSSMMDDRSFCGMSPCIADTVKLASRIFSVSQSTCVRSRAACAAGRGRGRDGMREVGVSEDGVM